MANRASVSGRVFGLIVFLVGVALLIWTFKLAFDLFSQDPSTFFRPPAGKPIDVNQAGANLMGLIVRILILCVMAVFGGMIANRGIRLYSDSGKVAASE
jgi:hypothetical protein